MDVPNAENAGAFFGGISRFDRCAAPAAVQIARAICRTGAAPQGSRQASLSARPKKNPAKAGLFFGLAEREGFEPSIRY